MKAGHKDAPHLTTSKHVSSYATGDIFACSMNPSCKDTYVVRRGVRQKYGLPEWPLIGSTGRQCQWPFILASDRSRKIGLMLNRTSLSSNQLLGLILLIDLSLQWSAVRVTPSGNPRDLNFSKTAAGITKWFWVTTEGYLSYLLPKFKDLIPTSLGDIAI